MQTATQCAAYATISSARIRVNSQQMCVCAYVHVRAHWTAQCTCNKSIIRASMIVNSCSTNSGVWYESLPVGSLLDLAFGDQTDKQTPLYNRVVVVA